MLGTQRSLLRVYSFVGKLNLYEPPNQQHMTETPVLYPSQFGGQARNCVTGKKYGFNQGDLREGTLFAVNYTLGDIDAKGFEVPPGMVYKEAPLRLLFDSPTQYYEFWDVADEDRDPSVIATWRSKVRAVKKKLGV